GNNPGARPHIEILDAAPARINVAGNRTHVLFRSDRLHFHYGFKQHRRRTFGGILESHRSGDLERHFRRVHFVKAAIVERHLYVDHLIAGEHAAFHRFSDAFFNRLDVLARYDAAYYGVDELKPRTGIERLDLELRVSVLTAAAGL